MATVTDLHVVALVRAIRRAYGSPSIVGFTVADVFDFARRLLAEGVTAKDDAE